MAESPCCFLWLTRGTQGEESEKEHCAPVRIQRFGNNRTVVGGEWGKVTKIVRCGGHTNIPSTLGGWDRNSTTDLRPNWDIKRKQYFKKVWEKWIWLEYNVRKPLRINISIILKIIAIHTLCTTFYAREENNHGWMRIKTGFVTMTQSSWIW